MGTEKKRNGHHEDIRQRSQEGFPEGWCVSWDPRMVVMGLRRQGRAGRKCCLGKGPVVEGAWCVGGKKGRTACSSVVGVSKARLGHPWGPFQGHGKACLLLCQGLGWAGRQQAEPPGLGVDWENKSQKREWTRWYEERLNVEKVPPSSCSTSPQADRLTAGGGGGGRSPKQEALAVLWILKFGGGWAGRVPRAKAQGLRQHTESHFKASPPAGGSAGVSEEDLCPRPQIET